MTVSDLELRLPTVDQPDGVFVEQPAPKFVPAGYVEMTPPSTSCLPRSS